jgi:glycosyltransferase involved in cell wall biosynthesis
MTGATLPISVVVIARNEERRIGDCLSSVRLLIDDIVVVDSISSDRTAEIAEAAGARVFVRAWPGYSEQKNFGNGAARYNWILSLDADERVSPELAASLRREFDDDPRCDVYDIRFKNYFGTQRVRFGAWNPEWHARLFDRRLFTWNTDNVHEGLCGPEAFRRGRLNGPIIHLTVDGHAQLAEKSERYATLFAAKVRRRSRHPSWPKVWLNPAWRFIRDYLVRLGILDGTPGFLIAWEAARYTHLKYRLAQIPRPAWYQASWLRLGSAAAALALVLSAPQTRQQLGWVGPSHDMPASVETNLVTSPSQSFAALDADDDDNSSLAPLSDDDVAV